MPYSLALYMYSLTIYVYPTTLAQQQKLLGTMDSLSEAVTGEEESAAAKHPSRPQGGAPFVRDSMITKLP